MYRFPRHLVTASALLSLAIASSRASAESAGSVPYLQTDRQTYRTGETLWFRLHGDPDSAPSAETSDGSTAAERRRRDTCLVRLRAPSGAIVAEDSWKVRSDKAIAGRFLVPVEGEVGPHVLEAEHAGRIVHWLALEIFDLALPQFDLELDVLASDFVPGETVTATLRALDLNGRPVSGARIEWLASFGTSRLREQGGKTDEDGRGIVRFDVPSDMQQSGHLSIAAVRGRRAWAVARRLLVLPPVARIDFFPEGGTAIEGSTHRVAFLVRDRRGQPVAASGRLVDGDGVTWSSWRADPHGLSSVLAPVAADRELELVVDRPATEPSAFPLPALGRDRYSLRVERNADKLDILVRGAPSTRGERVQVALIDLEKSRLLGTRQLAVDSAAGASELPDTLRLPRTHIDYPVDGLRGFARVLLIRGGRLLLARTVFLGDSHRPQVSLSTSDSLLFVRRDGELRLQLPPDLQGHEADLSLSIRRGPSAAEGGYDLQTAALRWELCEGNFPVELFRGDGANPEAADDWLLVHAAHELPNDGIEIEPGEVPSLQALRRHLPTMEPDNSTPTQKTTQKNRTRVERTAVTMPHLERLLDRAAYTREARKSLGGDTHLPNRALRQQIRLPGLGRRQSKPPQSQRVGSGRLDNRNTLYWSPRLGALKKGGLDLKFPLGDLSGELTWVLEGTVGGKPLAASGELLVRSKYRVELEAPRYLRVGDEFEALIRIQACRFARGKLTLDLVYPRSVEALFPTRIQFDPRLDSSTHRVKFRALRASRFAEELRLVGKTKRYTFQRTSPLTVREDGVLVRLGESGTANGDVHFEGRVPKDAVPGSIHARASVSSHPLNRSIDWLRRLLREPTGCFEQFTSKNYANLLVLDTLLESGADAELLRRAYLLADEGFRRLLEYHDEKSGAFRLFPGEAPSFPATLVAIRHLALYDRVRPGCCRAWLERGVGWLEKRPEASAVDRLHVLIALSETGRDWREGEAVLDTYRPKTRYTTSLLACALAKCLSSRDGRDDQRMTKWRTRLDELLAKLDAKRRSPESPISYEYDRGSLFASSGSQLKIESLAYEVLALSRLGEDRKAREVYRHIERLMENCTGTRAGLLAARAGVALGLEKETLAVVTFHTDESKSDRTAVPAGSSRSVQFASALDIAPGDTARVGVEIDSARELPYRLQLQYRTPTPVISKRAAYELSIRTPRTLSTGQSADLYTTIRPRKTGRALGRTQVVARIELPGGCELVESEWRRRLQRSSQDELCPSHWELGSGYIDLYWANAPRRALNLSIPIRARVAGRFRALPSWIGPYYSAEARSWSPAVELSIRQTYGVGTDQGMRPPGR